MSCAFPKKYRMRPAGGDVAIRVSDCLEALKASLMLTKASRQDCFKMPERPLSRLNYAS